MEKIFGYITQKTMSAIGVTLLTGLTITSSVVGASKIVQSVQAKEPTSAIVRNQVMEQTSPSSNQSKSVILAKFDSSKATTRTSPTPTVAPKQMLTVITPSTATSTSTPAPNDTSKCIVTLFSSQYDVTPLQTGHSGGNIFNCGTDMSVVYQSQHGTNVSRMAPYILNAANPNSTPPSTPTVGRDDDDEDDEHEEERRSVEKDERNGRKVHEIDDDVEEDD